MNCLTPRPQLANNRHTAAKSAVWFGDQLQVKGAPAPSNLLGAFFTPEGFLYGDVHGDTFGYAGDAFDCRFANPVYVVTTFFGEMWWRLGSTQSKVTTMQAQSTLPPGTPEECYTFMPAVFIGTIAPLDAISVAANRSSSIVRMMMLALEADDQPAPTTTS